MVHQLLRSFKVFRFHDRKDTRFLLAPTHEEEITTLVGGLTTSYKNLPLRVYQISESPLIPLFQCPKYSFMSSKEVPR